MSGSSAPRIAVVIPAFRVTRHILQVITRIGPEVKRVFVVDDKCPDGSGELVATACADNRVVVLRNAVNLGVGGAVLRGYRAAIDEGMDIIVKVDGDGQMDPALIPQLVAPIIAGECDYAKGNRFFSPESLKGMPVARLIGNAGLSFLTKLSSGYWDILDPTNGFTAIHAAVADVLPTEKIATRYFFESDLLFRLNTVRAVVADVPMFSRYDVEESNMKAGSMLLPFFVRNLVNFGKRVLYSYFLRGFSFASFCLVFGLTLLMGGLAFGLSNWASHSAQAAPTPTGTIMLSVVALTLGFQLVMSFFAADIAATPTRALHTTLAVRLSKPLRHFQTVGAPSGVVAG